MYPTLFYDIKYKIFQNLYFSLSHPSCIYSNPNNFHKPRALITRFPYLLTGLSQPKNKKKKLEAGSGATKTITKVFRIFDLLLLKAIAVEISRYPPPLLDDIMLWITGFIFYRAFVEMFSNQNFKP